LKPILDNNPGLINALSKIIEERRELLTKKEHQSKEKTGEKDKNVFKSIRKFFGLN
jgi:hypothetical protein